MSSIVNKIKDAVHSHQPSSEPTGTHGLHSSRVANAADPRVDSDRDHRAAPGTTGSSTDYTSSNNYTYAPATGTTTSTNAGPHQSNMANKLDPRVDSDRDRRGAPGHTGMTGTTYSSGLTGSNTQTTAGPHQSDMMNKVDPRVDSDRDHRGAPGHSGMTGATGTTYGTGARTTGYDDPEGTHGPHNSRVANTLDPRVDSDLNGSTTIGGNKTYHS